MSNTARNVGFLIDPIGVRAQVFGEPMFEVIDLFVLWWELGITSCE
jgi:hypothetical protein